MSKKWIRPTDHTMVWRDVCSLCMSINTGIKAFNFRVCDNILIINAAPFVRKMMIADEYLYLVIKKCLTGFENVQSKKNIKNAYKTRVRPTDRHNKQTYIIILCWTLFSAITAMQWFQCSGISKSGCCFD